MARPRVASAARPVYDSLSAPNPTASAVLKGRPLQSDHALPSLLVSLFPTFDGRPLQSVHALPSPLSSLLPTFDGRPLQSVHALPSPLFSLFPMKEDIRGPFVSIRGSPFNGRVALLPRGRAQARQPHVISQRRGRGHSLPEDYSRIQDPFRNIYLAVMRCLR